MKRNIYIKIISIFSAVLLLSSLTYAQNACNAFKSTKRQINHTKGNVQQAKQWHKSTKNNRSKIMRNMKRANIDLQKARRRQDRGGVIQAKQWKNSLKKELQKNSSEARRAKNELTQYRQDLAKLQKNKKSLKAQCRNKYQRRR